MIAEIDAKGVLMIKAETPVESYALVCWTKANVSTIGTRNILFDPDEEKFSLKKEEQSESN